MASSIDATCATAMLAKGSKKPPGPVAAYAARSVARSTSGNRSSGSRVPAARMPGLHTGAIAIDASAFVCVACGDSREVWPRRPAESSSGRDTRDASRCLAWCRMAVMDAPAAGARACQPDAASTTAPWRSLVSWPSSSERGASPPPGAMASAPPAAPKLTAPDGSYSPNRKCSAPVSARAYRSCAASRRGVSCSSDTPISSSAARCVAARCAPAASCKNPISAPWRLPNATRAWLAAACELVHSATVQLTESFHGSVLSLAPACAAIVRPGSLAATMAACSRVTRSSLRSIATTATWSRSTVSREFLTPLISASCCTTMIATRTKKPTAVTAE
mmetsp:Transcript_24604/g.93005  ORF Transcript_24604/g.93005 Transcript_24604/m.93005 type:complete len:334 (-) Transcript_24604:106-1107(-)